MKKQSKQTNTNSRIVAQNKRAKRDFEIWESIEAGIALKGTEIKAIRAGKVSFKDCYVDFRQGEAYLSGLYIGHYENSGYSTHDPERERKLLLHKREIEKLRGKSEQKGMTVIPTRIYLKDAKAKAEIALARGKRVHDRREELKQRTIQRETEREMAKYK